MNRKQMITTAACFAVLALTGCGSKPSSGDIDKTVRQIYSSMPVGGIKIHEVKKVGCAAVQGTPGFNCDIEVDATAPLVGRRKDVARLRFVKTGDGWKVSQ